jgi:RimJ/RimL family protein N-acetyltransferase
MSYLKPEYRGRRLSNTLNDMRLNWAVASGRFKRIVGSHRGSNQISSKVLDRMKFARGSRATRIWPDGATDDEIFYQFDIEPDGVA